MSSFIDDLSLFCEVSETDQAEMLQEILNRATAAYGNDDSASLHLVRGYAAYHFPELIQDSLDVEAELNAVLSERPDDTTARFYLACHLFDIGDVRKAHEQFTLLDTSQFVKSGQTWRLFKIDELILCCDAQLEQCDCFVTKLSQLIDRIVATSSDNIPAPIEVVRCFETCGQRLSKTLGIDAYRECLSLLQTYITHAGMSEEFENRMSHLRIGNGNPT
ncbi:MAG: hypothetical protein JWP89_1204 [Schlesneria sp.]|nr:hypothetical protein [Schlesneria sp.]